MKRYRLRAPLVLSLLVAMFAVAASPASAQTAAGFNSTRPAERVEYWQKRLNEISARMDRPDSLADVRLLFLGDSITDFWTMGDNPWFPGAVGGRAV